MTEYLEDREDCPERGVLAKPYFVTGVPPAWLMPWMHLLFPIEDRKDIKLLPMQERALQLLDDQCSDDPS